VGKGKLKKKPHPKKGKDKITRSSLPDGISAARCLSGVRRRKGKGRKEGSINPEGGKGKGVQNRRERNNPTKGTEDRKEREITRKFMKWEKSLLERL